MSGGRVRGDDVLIVAVVIDYALHTGPRVLDVVEISPQIAPLSYSRIVWLRETKRGQSIRLVITVIFFFFFIFNDIFLK